MGRGFSKFVGYERMSPTFRETPVSHCGLLNVFALTSCRSVEFGYICQAINSVGGSEGFNVVSYLFLQRLPPSDNSSNGDDTVGMKPLEVLQVPIKKGVFVVPFYLKGKCAHRKLLNMVNLVRN